MTRRIRTLLFSTLYPSSARPAHGIFVETRLRELLASGEVESKVIAPVPWFFSGHPRYGGYAVMARTPHHEIYHDLEVWHPRYWVLPKFGMSIVPFFLALASIPTVRRMLDGGYDFDLIDAHYYYPDGVAAALIAQYFRKPLVVTARGTDINLIPRYRMARKWIKWAASRAHTSIGVCTALIDRMAALGIARSRLLALRNGVDLRRFCPIPQMEARAGLGWSATAPTLLSVGHLVESKGHQVAVEALKHLPEYRLCIVGAGEEQRNLQRQAESFGVSPRVLFAGSVPQSELPRYYSASDVLVLCSSREGWANVLLESMACGTPVVATRVGGTAEVVCAAEAGRLISDRTGEAVAAAVRDLTASSISRSAVRAHAERFGWGETTLGQVDLFRRILGDTGDSVTPARGVVERCPDGRTGRRDTDA